MNILDKIIEHKRGEVDQLKNLISDQQAWTAAGLLADRHSRWPNLFSTKKSTGIIAEFKREVTVKRCDQRDSIGWRNDKRLRGRGLFSSCLFWQIQIFLVVAMKIWKKRGPRIRVPIIRKDFTIDEYQVVEAKSIGADAILLIASVLDPKRIETTLTALAHSLSLTGVAWSSWWGWTEGSCGLNAGPTWSESIIGTSKLLKWASKRQNDWPRWSRMACS